MVINVVGARPNYMKMAPIINGLNDLGIKHILVHTGQHYDDNMSKVFFDDLKMPVPNIFLGVRTGSHAEITAKIMVKFEKIDEIKIVEIITPTKNTLGFLIFCSTN